IESFRTSMTKLMLADDHLFRWVWNLDRAIPKLKITQTESNFGN
ncbi:unnamed protein product, partial [Rotaria sp. Silwood1]